MIHNMSAKEFQKKILPNFYGIMETLHYSKGRVRLKIALLKGNPEMAEHLENILSQIKPVKSYMINTTIGTLLVTYDETEVETSILIGSLIKIMGLEEEINKSKDGRLSYLMRDLLKGIDLAIYNNSKGILDGKSLLTISFLGLGIYQLKNKKILPNGVNLLWWAYRNSQGGKF